MKTRTKIWLGVGAFALAQVAGVSMNNGRPSLALGQPAQAADGVCGWERSGENGRWHYDKNCERGERYVGYRPYYHNERGERWNERGERWNHRDHRWERGDGWRNGRDRWGERG